MDQVDPDPDPDLQHCLQPKIMSDSGSIFHAYLTLCPRWFSLNFFNSEYRIQPKFDIVWQEIVTLIRLFNLGQNAEN